jgi:hypothetical protein
VVQGADTVKLPWLFPLVTNGLDQGAVANETTTLPQPTSSPTPGPGADEIGALQASVASLPADPPS